jgi:hypothetical protein
MMEGGALALIIFCVAIKTPGVVAVSAHVTTSIFAAGAAALAHSASSVASSSSPFAPGSEQLEVPCGGAGLMVLYDPAV